MIFQNFLKFSPKMQFSQLSFMISSCPQKIILRLCRMEFKSDKLILRIYIYRIFTFQSGFLYFQSVQAHLFLVKATSSSKCHQLCEHLVRLIYDISKLSGHFYPDLKTPPLHENTSGCGAKEVNVNINIVLFLLLY